MQLILLFGAGSILMFTPFSYVDKAMESHFTATLPPVSLTLPTIRPETQSPAARIKLDLNHVDAWMLTAIPGVGEAIAQRVIDYRTAHDGFTDTSELLRVGGIGEKLYAQMSEYVFVSP